MNATPEDELGQQASRAGLIAIQLTMQFDEANARVRERAARVALSAREQATRELRERFDFDKGVAESRMRDIYDSRWWDTADPRHVAEQWELAQTWREHSPAAVDAQRVLDRELRERYGTDSRQLVEQADEYERSGKWADVHRLGQLQVAESSEHRENASASLAAENERQADAASDRPVAEVTTAGSISSADAENVVDGEGGTAGVHEGEHTDPEPASADGAEREQTLTARGVPAETARLVVRHIPHSPKSAANSNLGRRVGRATSPSRSRGYSRDLGR